MRMPWLKVSREWRAAPLDGGQADLERALSRESGRFVAYDRNLPTRLQDGPTCGLCALSIAARALLHFGTLPDDPHDEADIAALVAAAREAGVSNHGEMFTARALEELASSHYGLRASLVVHPHADDIRRRLAAGAVALIAYDRDHDNSPRQTGGQNAHWALIRGWVERRGALDTDADATLLLDIVDLSKDQVEDLAPCDASMLWFICQQTKSRWVAAWPAAVLLASNAQLRHCSDPAYLIPEDLTDTLAERIIFLTRP